MLASHLHILVVDDDPTARATLAELLALWGASVRTAASAREAREAYVEMRPDVLISDIGMPDGDGCGLIRELRALDRALGDDHLHAIACTGCAAPADRARALDCGFDSVLAKPVDAQALRKLLAQGAGSAERWPVDMVVSPTRDS